MGALAKSRKVTINLSITGIFRKLGFSLPSIALSGKSQFFENPIFCSIAPALAAAASASLAAPGRCWCCRCCHHYLLLPSTLPPPPHPCLLPAEDSRAGLRPGPQPAHLPGLNVAAERVHAAHQVLAVPCHAALQVCAPHFTPWAATHANHPCGARGLAVRGWDALGLHKRTLPLAECVPRMPLDTSAPAAQCSAAHRSFCLPP